MDPYMLQRPYTTTLSLLRKIDLMRLSLEFKLPTEGNVMILRDRLRVYLNAHSETLWKNPRFRPLYPQHRRVTQPVVQQPPETADRTPSPTPSSSSDSSADSFESWHGIEEVPAHHPLQPEPQQLPPAPAQAPPLNQHIQDFYPPPPPPPPPSPSPSIPASEPGFPPPSDHPDGPRKFFFSLHSFTPWAPFLVVSLLSNRVYLRVPSVSSPPYPLLLPMIPKSLSPIWALFS